MKLSERLLVIVACLVVLTAMTAGAAYDKGWFHAERDWSPAIRDSNLEVGRIHDDELHVTCWVVSGPARGGISCLPDSAVPR